MSEVSRWTFVAVWKLKTPKFTCTVMEAPGHRDFIVMVGGGTGELEAARLVKLNI